MKPGGLCSPSHGSSTPSGDGIGSVSSCKSIAGGSQYPDASTSSENPPCLTPDHLDDRHLGSKANRSIANGFSPDSVANGVCEEAPCAPDKRIDVPRHVLSPPCSEDGEEGASASHTISPGSVAGNPGTSTLYQGRSDISLSQANILDFGNAAEALPKVHAVPTEEPLPGTSEQVNSVYNVFSNHGAAYVGDSRMECPKADTNSLPQNKKSPKYRRKCSLEEMVAKLHNRTEPNPNCINVFKGFPALRAVGEPGIGKTPCGVQEAKDTSEPSSCQVEDSQSVICDKLNTATCDARPAMDFSHEKDAYHTRDSDEPADLCDRSLECGSRLCDSSNKEIESVESLCENIVLPNQSDEENDSGACEIISTTAEKVESLRTPEDIYADDKRTAQSSNTKDVLCNEDVAVAVCKDAQNNSVLIEPLISNAEDVSVDKDAKQKSPGSPSPLLSECCGVGDVSEKASVRLEAQEKKIKNIVDLTGDLESIGSSSVDVIDNETQDSGSDLEILYEKRKDDRASFCGALSSSELSQISDKNRTSDKTSDGSDINVLPSIVNCGNGSVQYLEPISDEENSLLCAPSLPSDLSLVSGTQSNSNTPLFSDTPSDTSRGAIMVKISDAVAAILSDVSDDSLPPSPDAGDTGLPNTFSNILPTLKGDNDSCKRLPEDSTSCVDNRPAEECVPITGDEKNDTHVNVGAKENEIQSDSVICDEEFVESNIDVSNSLSTVIHTKEISVESPKKITVEPCKEITEPAHIDSTKISPKDSECESKSVNIYLGDSHSQSETASQIDSLLPASKRIPNSSADSTPKSGSHMQDTASIAYSSSSSASPLCQNSTSGTLNVSSQNVQSEKDITCLDCNDASRLEDGRQGGELDVKDTSNEGRISSLSARDCSHGEPSEINSESKDSNAAYIDSTILKSSRMLTTKERITSAADSVTTHLDCSEGVDTVSSNEIDLLPVDTSEAWIRVKCPVTVSGDVAEGSVSKDLTSPTSPQATTLVEALANISDHECSNTENQRKAPSNLKNSPLISDGSSSECTNLASTCIVDENVRNIQTESLTRADAISETNLISSKQTTPVEALFSDSSTSSDEVSIVYDISCLASSESEPQSVEVLQNSTDSTHPFGHSIIDDTGLLLTNPTVTSDLTKSEVSDNLVGHRNEELAAVMADDRENTSGDNCSQTSFTASNEHQLAEVLCGNSSVTVTDAKKDQVDHSDISLQSVQTADNDDNTCPNFKIDDTVVNPCLEPTAESTAEDTNSSSFLKAEIIPVLSKDKVETDQQANFSSDKSLPQDVILVNTVKPSPVYDSKQAPSVTKVASDSNQVETAMKRQTAFGPKTPRIQLQRNNLLQSGVFCENTRTVSESARKNVVDTCLKHHGKNELSYVETADCAATSPILTKTDDLPTMKVNKSFEMTEADRDETVDRQCLLASDSAEKTQIVQESYKDSIEENLQFAEGSQIPPLKKSQDTVTSVEDVDSDVTLASGIVAESSLSNSMVMQTCTGAESGEGRRSMDKDILTQNVQEIPVHKESFVCSESSGIENIAESLESENSVKQLPSSVRKSEISQPSDLDLSGESFAMKAGEICYDYEVDDRRVRINEKCQESTSHSSVGTLPSSVEGSARCLSPRCFDFDSGKTSVMKNGENTQSLITGTICKLKEDCDQLVSTAAVNEYEPIDIGMDHSSNLKRHEEIQPSEAGTENKTCVEGNHDKMDPLQIENIENLKLLVSETENNWYVDTSNEISHPSHAGESDVSKKLEGFVNDNELGNSESFNDRIVPVDVAPNQMNQTAAGDTLKGNLISGDGIEKQFRHALNSSSCQLDNDDEIRKAEYSLPSNEHMTSPQHSSNDGLSLDGEIFKLKQVIDSQNVASVEVHGESSIDTSHTGQVAFLKSTESSQPVTVNSIQEKSDTELSTEGDQDPQSKGVISTPVTRKFEELDILESDKCIGDLSAVNMGESTLNVERECSESHQLSIEHHLGESSVALKSSMDVEGCKAVSEITVTSCESIMQDNEMVDVNSSSVVSDEDTGELVNVSDAASPKPTSVDSEKGKQLVTETVEDVRDILPPPTEGIKVNSLSASSNCFVSHACEADLSNIPSVVEEVDDKRQDASAESSSELHSSAEACLAECYSLDKDETCLTDQIPADNKDDDHLSYKATWDRSLPLGNEDSHSTITNDVTDQVSEVSSGTVISLDVPVANVGDASQMAKSNVCPGIVTSHDEEHESSNVYNSSHMESCDNKLLAARDGDNCLLPVEFSQQIQMNISKEDNVLGCAASDKHSNIDTCNSTSATSVSHPSVDKIDGESESCPLTYGKNLDPSASVISCDSFLLHEDACQEDKELKVTSLEDVEPKSSSHDHDDQSKDSFGSNIPLNASVYDACLLSTPSPVSVCPTATPALSSLSREANLIHEEKGTSGTELPHPHSCSIQDESSLAPVPPVSSLSLSGCHSQESDDLCSPKSNTSGLDGLDLIEHPVSYLSSCDEYKSDHVLDPNEGSSLPCDFHEESVVTEDHYRKTDVSSSPIRLAEQDDAKSCNLTSGMDIAELALITQNLPPLLSTEENQFSGESPLEKINTDMEECDSHSPYKHMEENIGIITPSSEEVDGMGDVRKTEKNDSSFESPIQGPPAENVSVQEIDRASNSRLSGDEDNSALLKVGEVKTELCSPSEETSSLLEDLGSDINKGTSHIFPNIFNAERSTVTSEETVGREDTEIQIIGSPCPLCREMLAEPLQEHIIKHHTCVSFIPAKATSAYQSHMLQRVDDTTDVSSMLHDQDYAYVCRSCEFSSKDINAVRFHLNVHEDVFQVNTGLATCDCNKQIYSYQFHRWKSLIHGSPNFCYQCNHYFACERSLINHLIALHYPQNQCTLCSFTVSEDNVIYHTDLHRNDSNAVEDESVLSDAPITTRSKGSYGVAWNIHDNYLNYLDGKYFRLSIAAKVADKTRDRSYLTLPIKNVLEEVSVPDKAKLDPARDIRKYLQGKKDIKVNDEEINEALKNFSWFVQMDLEKKCNQKKTKASGHSNKTKRESDLFDSLGIVPLKLKGPSKKDLANKNTGKSSKKRAMPDASVVDDSLVESSKLTRTRSGMQPNRDDGENDEKYESSEISVEGNDVSVSGEWSKDHTYVCCSCGTGYLDLADIMDHKWEHHPSVWCAHTMFQGQDSVPLSFCKQFQPPADRPHKLPLPSLPSQQPPSETEPKKGDGKVSENTQQACSLCSSSFGDMESFHSHLVECGGLNQMVIVKKKNKKGFRFKRRKGQGVPSNRYGIGSLPSTPLKAKFGDRSSGLNTPPMDKSSSSAIHSSGVKRRLELAVGLINNDELKNRLKAIISKSRSSSFNTLGLPSRRTIRMKLRKKALDTKWLRKTRHSDKAKEDPSKVQKSDEKKVGGSKDEKKGSADLAKEKKVKDSSEIQNDTDMKSKLQKNIGKLSGSKKGSSVNVSEGDVEQLNSTTSSVTNVANPSKASKKKSKAQNSQFSKKMQAGKMINGVISKQKMPKEIVKTVEPASAEAQAIDVKKVLAKKILSKKNKNLSDVSVDSQNVTVGVVESDFTADTDEISVQKKVKQTGKTKSSTTQLKAKYNNTESTFNEKASSKKSKNINLSQSKSKISKAKPSSNIKATKKSTKSLTKKITEVVKNSFSKTKQDGKIPSKRKEPLNEEQKGVDSLTGGKAKASSKPVLTKDEVAVVDSSSIGKRRRYSSSSSSEESEDSEDDSEPEVIRNFRSGRGCTGRTGLRSKKRLVHSRYSFRTCIKPTKKEVRAEENEEEENESENLGSKSRTTCEEKDLGPDKGELSDDIPLSKRRKRKIASFENYDDCAYIPNETSSYSEGDDSSLENYPIAKLKKMHFSKKRKVLTKKSQIVSEEESLQNTKVYATENMAVQNERDETSSKVSSAGQIRTKNVEKKIRALHEASFKKIKNKYVKVRKVKNALRAYSEGNSDTQTLEPSVENSSEIPISVQTKSKSKVKKQTVRDKEGLQENERILEGVIDENLPKVYKKKGVAGVGRLPPKQGSKSRSKKLNSNVTQHSDVHGYVSSDQDIVKKTSRKPAIKKISKKTPDLAVAMKNQNIVPGKIKSRSRSITLGSLDRVQEANNAVKKSSSMSDIPQGMVQETVEKLKKSTVSSSTSTLSNLNNFSECEDIPGLLHEQAGVQQTKLKGLDVGPNCKRNQRMKSVRKRNKQLLVPRKVGVCGKATDLSSTVESLAEDASESPSSLTEPFNENIALVTTKNVKGRNVGRKTRDSSASNDVLQSGTNLGLGNIRSELVRKPRRVNRLEDVVTFSEEENSAPELSGTKILETESKIACKTVAAHGRKPVLQRHFGSTVDGDKKIQKSKNLIEVAYDDKECNVEPGEEYSAAEVETSNADEVSDSSFGMVDNRGRKKSRKRKLKVESLLPTCADGNSDQSIEFSDVVPSKKHKRALNPIGKVKKSVSMPKLTKVFKEAGNVGCIQSVINNHTEKKKINRENVGKVKRKTVIHEKDIPEVKVDHSKTVLKNKLNDSTFDSMPVLEPMNIIKPSLNCQTNHNIWKNDLATLNVPSKIKRRRSSVEKIKDIPTRSSANQNHPDCPSPPELQAFSDEHQLFKQGLLTPSEETALHMLPIKKASKKSGSKKRQTQSSLEAAVKEGYAGDPSLSLTSSASKASKENKSLNSTSVAKKSYKRKRASSVPGLSKNKLVNDHTSVSKTEVSQNDVKKLVTKRKKVGQKKKTNKDDGDDIKCLDCGLRFDSFASLEDHRQDCITIALEMSLMEAEDHLYECQHCHLTFALKGTHRQHTASCRLGKYRRPVHKNDTKVRKRTSGRATHSQGADISAAESDLGVSSSVQSDGNEQNINDLKIEANALSPVASSKPKPPSESLLPVAGSSKTDHIQDQVPSNLKGSSKLRKRSRTNEKVDSSVVAEQISSITSEEKCIVCGCEIKDKDMSNMHLLLEQFAHCCKEQAVLEVCVLIAYYNLGMDTIKSMVASAIFYQGSTILKLDAKLQTFPDFDPVFSSVENKTASQLMQILASPHCMWVSPVLEAQAKHYYTVEAVSISGTCQEALKAVTVLEELFKEITSVDNSIRKNQMLRTMKETFEAGTL